MERLCSLTGKRFPRLIEPRGKHFIAEQQEIVAALPVRRKSATNLPQVFASYESRDKDRSEV
jgi:hypothetical protein